MTTRSFSWAIIVVRSPSWRTPADLTPFRQDHGCARSLVNFTSTAETQRGCPDGSAHVWAQQTWPGSPAPQFAIHLAMAVMVPSPCHPCPGRPCQHRVVSKFFSGRSSDGCRFHGSRSRRPCDTKPVRRASRSRRSAVHTMSRARPVAVLESANFAMEIRPISRSC